MLAGPSVLARAERTISFDTDIYPRAERTIAFNTDVDPCLPRVVVRVCRTLEGDGVRSAGRRERSKRVYRYMRH